MSGLLSQDGDLQLDTSVDLVRETNPVRQAVQLRLTTERGSCFWDVAFGSTLHELRQAKVTATFSVDLESRIRTALRPMTTAGELTILGFRHERPTKDRWHVQFFGADRGRRPITFDLFLEVA